MYCPVLLFLFSLFKPFLTLYIIITLLLFLFFFHSSSPFLVSTAPTYVHYSILLLRFLFFFSTVTKHFFIFPLFSTTLTHLPSLSLSFLFLFLPRSFPFFHYFIIFKFSSLSLQPPTYTFFFFLFSFFHNLFSFFFHFPSFPPNPAAHSFLSSCSSFPFSHIFYLLQLHNFPFSPPLNQLPFSFPLTNLLALISPPLPPSFSFHPLPP